jgi:hypothetical protein
VPGGFSRAAARALSPHRLTSCGPTQFLDSHGPRARILCSLARLRLSCSPLYFYLPIPAWHLMLLSACPSLSAKSARCRFLPDYLFPNHESFTISPILLTPFLLVFHTQYDHLSRVIKRDEPKSSFPLTYLISDSLIVHPVCTPVLKDSTPCYTQCRRKGLLCI